MLVKGKSYPVNNVPCGIHLVTIRSISVARNKTGVPITTKNGVGAIRIIFKSDTGWEVEKLIWLTESSKWVLKLFLSALGIEQDDGIPVERIEKKKLYICISYTYSMDGDKRMLDMHGKEIYKTDVMPKFFKYDPALGKPDLSDDPDKHEGKAVGSFYKTVQHSYQVDERYRQ